MKRRYSGRATNMTDAKSGQSTKRIIQKTYFIPYCRQVKTGVIAGIKSRPHYLGRAFAIQENRTILHFMHVITVHPGAN